VRRILVGGVACILASSLLAGCANSSAHSDNLGHGVSIGVPTGSASFTPRATPVPNVEASFLSNISLSDTAVGPSPFVSLATPVRLTSGGPFPKGGVDLSFRVGPKSVPVGMKPFLASYDATNDSWDPVSSTYDSSTGTVQAHVTHFSIWGVFSFVGSVLKTLAQDAFTSVFGSIKVTDPAPTCGDSTGLTASSAPPDGILEVCAQNGSGTSATLKVKSYLSFPVDVVPPSGTQISVIPTGDLFAQIGGYLNKVGTGQPTRTLIAAGSEADLTFPVAAGSSVRVASDLDTIAYLAGIIDSGISVLTAMEKRLGANPSATLNSIAQGKCAAEASNVANATSPVSVAALTGLTQLAFDCASIVAELGITGVVQGIISTVAGLVENVLQTGFLAAMIIVGGVSGTTSTITVSRSTPPAVVTPVASPCDASLLFQAAVAKEGFDPNDPSYAEMAPTGGGAAATDPTCDAGWAVAAVSRPNVGDTDGFTLFQSDSSGAWVEVGMLGGSVAQCNLETSGVPADIALALAHGVVHSGIAGC
jgi:hypothetical protein